MNTTGINLLAALCSLTPAMVQAATPSFSEKSHQAVAKLQSILPDTARIVVEYHYFPRKYTAPAPVELSAEETQAVLHVLQGVRPLSQRGKRYVRYKGTHRLLFYHTNGKKLGHLSMIDLASQPESTTDSRYAADAEMYLPPNDYKQLRQIITTKIKP